MLFENIHMIYQGGNKDWHSLTNEKKEEVFTNTKKYYISQIVDIECLIHQIKLSGKSYTYKDVENALGTLVPDNKFSGDRFYKKKSYRNFNGLLLTIMTSPVSGYLPQCMILATGVTTSDIYELAIALPKLRVSRAEYAFDFICRSPEHARNLFNILKRGIYVLNLREARYEIFGENHNMTLLLGDFKMYERGPDNKVKKEKRLYQPGTSKFWQFKDIDRVRLEYNAKRYSLDSCDTRSIHEFLASPEFHNMMHTPSGKKRFRFVKFKENPACPRECDSYSQKLGGKAPHSIQFEMFILKKDNSKAIRNLITDTTFGSLLIKIRRSVAKFGYKWRKDYRELIENNQNYEQILMNAFQA